MKIENVSQRIKEAREKARISVTGMARMLGISRQQQHRYESESSTSSVPPVEHLAKMAEITGTTTDFLLGRSEPKPPAATPPATEPTTTPDIAAIISRLDSIESATVEHYAAYKLNIETVKEFMQTHDAELKQELMAHEKSSTDRILEAVNAIVGSLFNMMKDAHSTERMGNVLKLIHGDNTKVVGESPKVVEEESKVMRTIPTLPYIRTKRPHWQREEPIRTWHAGGAGGISLQELTGRMYEAFEHGPIVRRVSALLPEPAPWCMPVSGHSMEPTILDGSTIYYKRATWEDIVDGDIVLLYDNTVDELKIRRAECQGNKRCVLVADNPEYGDRTPLDDTVVIVGLVLYADNGTIGGGRVKPRH